jgi:hypothetical protein
MRSRMSYGWRPAPPGAVAIAADGQLSLLSEVVFEEPPHPDDFETLDEFRKAIARWDLKHPSSFDHCSDHLPSSIDKLPSSIDKLPSSIDKPLELSLDSFCEWDPCPADWYEPAAIEPSKVMGLLPVHKSKSSSTWDFFIPTFGAEGDRTNGRDEPPDTGGIFARSPSAPKPPTFPRPSPTQSHTNRIPNAYQTHTKRIAAGITTQPARSPPGGDAVFA